MTSVLARDGALGRGKHPGVELIEGDAENLPFANESFDGVLLSGLVHHFPDPRRLAAEVRRVLKTGGRFEPSSGLRSCGRSAPSC